MAKSVQRILITLFTFVLLFVAVHADTVPFNTGWLSGWSTGAQTGRAGINITMSADLDLTNATRAPGSTYNRIAVYDAANTVLIANTSIIINNVFVFLNPVRLSSGTAYLIIGDSNGAVYGAAYRNPTTFPVNNASVGSITSTLHPSQAATTAEAFNIANLSFSTIPMEVTNISVASNTYSGLRLAEYSVGVSNWTYDYNVSSASWSAGIGSITEYNYTLSAVPAEGFVVLNFTNLSYTLPAYDVTGNSAKVQLRKEVNAVSSRMLSFYNYSSSGMTSLCGYAAIGCNYDSNHIEYYAKQRKITTANESLQFPQNQTLSNISVRSNTTNSYLNIVYYDVSNGTTLLFNYSVVNVSVRDTISNVVLWNLTTSLENRNTELTLTNATVSNQSIYYVEPGNYSISFTKSGYISQSMNISVGFGLNNVRFNTSPDNSVSLLFIDELNSSPQINVTFDIINDYFSKRIFMGTNTSLLLQSIPYGDYEFRYGVNSPTLQPRSYFISFPITTANLTNLTLRTINTTSSTLFIRNIVDATSQPMTGYVLDVQRFYTNGSTSTGAWETVSQAAIDQRGDAVFPAVPNTQAYRFRILNGSSIIDIFTPSYLVDQSSNFISKSSGSVLSNFKTAQNIGYTPIRNTSTQLVFDYSSATEINRICMDVLYEYRFNTSRVQACSTANSGTLASSIDPSRNGTYTATVYANVSGQIYTLDTIKYKPSGSGPLQTFGKYGLVIWLVSMLVAAIIGGFVNPIPGIVFAVTATIAYAASFIGLIQMSVTIAGGLLVTTIIILILFARKE